MRVKVFLIATLLFTSLIFVNSPVHAAILLGDLDQDYSFHKHYCADKSRHYSGGCVLFKTAAHKGWVYFVNDDGKISGSGLAKLEKGKCRVLKFGGGALGDMIIDFGCPKDIATVLLKLIVACEIYR